MTGVDKIGQTFGALKPRNEGALVVFVTGGDPNLAVLPEVLRAVQRAGADIIEVGIPFSDPIADGPAIQASSFRALENGATPEGVLQAIHDAKLDVPVLLMGYWNTVLRGGAERFAAESVEAGVCGTIICDLIPEEMGDWFSVSQSHGLANVLLCAPTSGPDRLKAAAQASTGFVYAVSRTGVTGTSTKVPEEARGLVGRIREAVQTPVCVGFGISEPSHVSEVCGYADGAIVGSRVVNQLHATVGSPGWVEKLEETVSNLKSATRT